MKPAPEGLAAPGRMQLELRLAIEHAVTRILDESASIDEAAPRVILAVREHLPWLCAGLWLPEGAAAPAAARGMRSVFSFPVGIPGRPAGAMEFFSRGAHRADAELLDCMRYLGRQIGQFIERTRAEEERRRFRTAMDASAELIMLVDPRRIRYLDANETACRKLGYAREELLRLGPHDIFSASREELAAVYQRLIAGDPAATAAEGWYRRKDGSRFLVESFRRALPAPAGHLIVAVARDIGERRRQELLLELEHAVTRCLSEADDAAKALTSVMRAVCEANGWECGRYYRRDPGAGIFALWQAWTLGVDALERFVAWSQDKTYAPGVGLVGRVGESGQPLWVADVSTDTRVAQAPPDEYGIRGVFVFPVESNGVTIGVLDFHSRELREPDERLLQTARVIGSQIGQFLRRKQAEEDVRQSEERFRALAKLSSDFYWETDAEHCIVQTRYDIDRRPVIPMDSRFGKKRWEMSSTHPDAAGWAAHRATMETHRPFRDFEFARLGADGLERHLSISGEPVFDRGGGFLGYRGVGKDITARKRAEQLQNLEHTVTRALAEADSVAEALKVALQAVCETEGWECGRYLRVDQAAGVLRVGADWGIQTQAIQRFLESSRAVTYAPGAGLAGRVWESGQPLWVSDIGKDARAAQSALIRELGLRGAVFFPMMVKGRMIGILAFNSREVREPEQRLLLAMRVISSQIGQFVQRKQAEEVMRQSEERFRSLTLLSSDIYWEQDEQFRFTQFVGTGSPRVNQSALRALGTKRWEQNYVNMRAEDWEQHIEMLEAHKPFRDLELCRLDEKGNKLWVSVSGEPVFDAAGSFKGYRGVGKDITARKLDEEYIHFLANHDALTALPNRFMFSQIVNHAIQSARRHSRGFALLFVDLDRFKIINDALGHEAGDRLLKAMAQRLADTVRSSDVVARLGGDEFVVLLQEVSDAQQVEIVARKVLAALIRPIPIGQHEYRVTASLGISMYPGDGQDEQSLMKNADIAMYAAKEDGKNTYKFYSAAANVHSFERLTLEAGLRRGLDENQFLLHYQPKVAVRSGAITGMEALVRWQHPELGMVPPGQFIPLAEESGLIVPLGKWVLRTACAQNMAWQRAGLPALPISVNISARQFADEELLKDIGDALAESAMQPQLLELELTESMVMRNPERALTVLEALERMGVRLAIDDFGVGYSSFAHLKRFPIDTLKVDRSLIRDIPQDPGDMAIAEAVIAMGKSLNLTVVAEGVETAEQHSFLRERGCDEAQGYYFSKPLAAEAAAEFILRAAATGPAAPQRPERRR